MFDELQTVREKILELTSRKSAMATALVPKEEALSRLAAGIDAVASRFTPDIRPLLRPDWHAGAGHRAIGSIVDRDIEAVLHALVGREILTRCAQEIDRVYATEAAGLPVAEREAELQRLDRTILALEKQEEAIIEAAEAAGLEIERRPDADPRAVLGIDVAA